MLGSCVLCHCYEQSSQSLCSDCDRLLIQLSGLYQNQHQEFSSLWQRFHHLGVYSEPLSSLLIRGKYQKDLTALKVLAGLLAKSIRQKPFASDAVIMPVPMSQSRFLERGFNQAAIIAREVTGNLCMSYADDLVQHTGQAQIQHQLGRRARERNMRHAFLVANKIPKRICIVDDIYTTGATMKAICRALRRAGCEYIEIWIIAKTL